MISTSLFVFLFILFFLFSTLYYSSGSRAEFDGVGIVISPSPTLDITPLSLIRTPSCGALVRVRLYRANRRREFFKMCVGETLSLYGECLATFRL